MLLLTDPLSWANTQDPEQLLLGILAALFGTFVLWCLATWLVSLVSVNAAIAIAPPLMRAVLLAGLVMSVAPTAQAEESPVDALSGLVLPERPAVEPHLDQRATTDAVDKPGVRAGTDRKEAAPSKTGAPVQMDKNGSAQANKARENIASSTAQSTARSEARTDTQTGALYVVKSGDTLWAIAAAQLGSQASPQDIAAEVRRWHEANRHTIGTNPDLIHPGQQLKEPRP